MTCVYVLGIVIAWKTGTNSNTALFHSVKQPFPPCRITN